MSGPSYATYAQFLVFGLPAASLSGTAFDQSAVESVLEADSRLLDRDLARRFTLPLTSWGADLTRDVCVLAAYDITSVLGFNPDGADDNLRKRYEDVLKRYPMLAEGEAQQGTDDQTPLVSEWALFTYSDDPRGF